MTLLALALLATPDAEAFCGFYVSGADAALYNDATLVVLMREGTTTALSMQNSVNGPPEDFALVVPVPVVLSEDNVKTLPAEVFSRVDSLAAPRLVEYWEADPCQPYMPPPTAMMPRRRGPTTAVMSTSATADYGVTIEAEFEVAEYDIVILSAKDSGGLDRWLRDNRYNIPEGAEPVLRPYVEGGTKFFVAKVDSEKVTFQDGRAVLSPLRVHYQSEAFSLPVRLGLLNSEGEQDLLVHVLARGQRYEVANYDNAFIPTNIRVLDGVRDGFGDFYDSLYRQTVSEAPRTVVTEYSWDASSCDPCPTPALQAHELASLGGDVMGSPNPRGWVLTRLHYRYTKDTLGDDLIFQAAPPMVGGRGMPDTEGELREQQAEASGVNNFQGRYVILHPWEDEVTCEQPMRGRWGGPNGQENPQVKPSPPSMVRPMAKAASLGQLIDQDIPWINVTKGQDTRTPEPAPSDPKAAPSEPAPLTPSDAPPPLVDGEPDVDDERGCASVPGGSSPWGLALLAGLALAARRRMG